METRVFINFGTEIPFFTKLTFRDVSMVDAAFSTTDLIVRLLFA